MARAGTRTILPLDTFARLVGLHPLHFNQVEVSDLAPATDASEPMLQYNWQDTDHISRENLAQEIRAVEEMLSMWLGFNPGPAWIIESYSITQPRTHPIMYTPCGWPEILRTGKIIGGGVETWTFVQNAGVVYTDEDSDTYFETATITVPTTITNVEELAVCYPGVEDASLWEIRPTKITVAAGLATIKCRREQLILASNLEALSPRAVDGLDDAQFLTTVDVYRHWNDPSDQGMIIWENVATPGVVDTETICIEVQDAHLGIVKIVPATWGGVSYTHAAHFRARRADRAVFQYYAGAPLRDLDATWAHVIMALTCAQLDRPLCASNFIQSYVQYWKEDKALHSWADASGSSWSPSKRVLENPFGTTRAAEYAWQAVQRSTIRR
jgi:hypothetical protein